MADLLHLVDKPEGWTSHDVVARMRSILGESRVGHAGTLDPFASGLLLVGEGRATGALGTLALLPKRYLARARLGAATNTQDRTGIVVRRSETIPGVPEIERALGRFRGEIRQVPPLYSAVKVRGERAYRAARRGVVVEREERAARVHELSLIRAELPEIDLDLTVSRGTYVRTLAHDLGEALGSCAHLVELRRTATGPFSVDDALSCERGRMAGPSDLRGRALTLDRALEFLPLMTLEQDEAERLRHGRAPLFAQDRVVTTRPPWPLPPGAPGWPILVTDRARETLALARPAEDQAAGMPLLLQRVLVGS
jgi:tRNA pseudouridine55 synthase